MGLQPSANQIWASRLHLLSLLEKETFVLVRGGIFMGNKQFVHPYIPNMEPRVKKEMLDAIGMTSVDEIYQAIPDRLRYKERMNLPEPLISEYTVQRHVEELLAKNMNARDNICFLGGGTWNHYVPSVVTTIMERDEFLTCYVGDAYTDHGKFQALFESSSMIGDLTGFEACCTPTYDWGNAIAIACRMAERTTGRKEILVAGNMAPDRLLIVKNYCKPEILITTVAYDKETGMMNLDDLKEKLSENVACVYFENPIYLGGFEENAAKIVELAHHDGATVMVGVDPTCLGVIEAPGEYGADYAVGDLQPLGLNMSYGGGIGGFIATKDDKEFLGEYPTLLYGICETEKDDEYGFGEVFYERTSYASREKGKDFIGTTTALHGIAAAVYMALMGPQGFTELGTGIMQRVAYARAELAKIPGIKTPGTKYSYCDFLVDFNDTGKTVKEINKALLDYKIIGGKDISCDFPEYGQCALYSVTEVHREEDLKALFSALKEIVG